MAVGVLPLCSGRISLGIGWVIQTGNNLSLSIQDEVSRHDSITDSFIIPRRERATCVLLHAIVYAHFCYDFEYFTCLHGCRSTLRREWELVLQELVG